MEKWEIKRCTQGNTLVEKILVFYVDLQLDSAHQKSLGKLKDLSHLNLYGQVEVCGLESLKIMQR